MDALAVAAQPAAVGTPSYEPVHRPPSGAIETRAVEPATSGTAEGALTFRDFVTPGVAVLHLLRRSAENAAAILETTRSIQAAQAMSGFHIPASIAPARGLDLYA